MVFPGVNRESGDVKKKGVETGLIGTTNEMNCLQGGGRVEDPESRHSGQTLEILRPRFSKANNSNESSCDGAMTALRDLTRNTE
jgi:hypothetical protein